MKIYVRWASNLPTDEEPFTLKRSLWSRIVCFVARKSFWVQGQTVHTKVSDALVDPKNYVPFIREALWSDSGPDWPAMRFEK